MSHARRDVLGQAGLASVAVARSAAPRGTAMTRAATAPTRSGLPPTGRHLRIVAGGSVRLPLLGRFERVEAIHRIAWFGEDR